MTRYADRAAWHAEATLAANGHVFAPRLPAAALLYGECALTATEAVTSLGVSLAEDHRDGTSWHYLADLIEVPVPVAVAWAVEGRIRQRAAALARPFRKPTTEKE